MYIINYGLAEFLAGELKDRLISTESFVVCFDAHNIGTFSYFSFMHIHL